MTTVHVNRHCVKQGGWQAGLGPRVGAYHVALETIPRTGEVFTFHPDGMVNDNSWSGEVTGVQHVVSIDRSKNVVVYYPHEVVLTVRDTTEAARALREV